MRQQNSVVSGSKFTKFSSQTWEKQWLIRLFSDCRYVDTFQRYSQSKSKVVRNCAKFSTFFALANFMGPGPPP